MSGINNSIQGDYTGPACLYKLLEPRQKKNPIFLARNALTFLKNHPPPPPPQKHPMVPSRRKRYHTYTFEIEILQKISNRVGFFFILDTIEKPTATTTTTTTTGSAAAAGAATTNVHHHYQIIDSNYVTVPSSETRFSCNFHFKKLQNIDFTKIHSIHLLIMHSPSENTNDTDFHRASCLCSRLNSFDFKHYLTEEISLKLKVPMCLIEMKQFLRNVLQCTPLSRFDQTNETSSTTVKTFRSFFLPYIHGTGKSIYKLSNRLQCQLFNLNENEGETIPFSFNVYPLRTIQLSQITAPLSESMKLGLLKKAKNTGGTDQAPIKYTKTKLHYHFLVKLQQKGKFVEFYSSSTPFIRCIWCSKKMADGIYFDRGNKCLASFSTSPIWQLFQHIVCCHYHFNSKFFLADDGSLHIYFSRSDSYLGDKSLFKGAKFFKNMRPCKLDHSSIFSMPWSKDNPIALSKIYTEYFHSSTGLPVSLEDMQYDSDEEELDVAATVHHRKIILDEYCDITRQEKELMELWNVHIATFPPYGDKLFPLVCQRFLVKFAKVIVDKKLRYNLLLHFLNMWDFGLLVAEEVYQYMQYVDKVAINI